MAIKIAINGFGRIGRLVYRIAAQRGGIDIVAVNDLVPAPNLAYLLRYDSTHGRFGKDVTLTDDGFAVGGSTTRCLSERDPASLPWGSLGVDYVLEATGLFTKHD
ncbi:MAG: type I glyceraldehyde-3-phosphate dehydrogenase, partial [Deltaproteobacteria bacterium]|nr:type I glyceraldehyde-3-phosphate dehydrogenase [Deltaproteobacteria bacterium]